MNRTHFLEMAAKGCCIPMATHLVLSEKENPEALHLDGIALGNVVEEANKRFGSKLAIPVMDLTIEKHTLVNILAPEVNAPGIFHFSTPPTEAMIKQMEAVLEEKLPQSMQAQCDSIRYVAEQTDLIPTGMTIGPFSLMTELIDDPVVSVCLLGMGMTPEDEPDVEMVIQCMELAVRIVLLYLQKQIDAGAKVIIMPEPAANSVFISPNQMTDGSDIFDRCIMDNLYRIKKLLTDNDVAWIFHDCGELTDEMLLKFSELHPEVLSLASTVKLPEVAQLVAKDIVLYGNLPSKKFYSDSLLSNKQVIESSLKLIQDMKDANHPFILGTECDVLHVDGCGKTIKQKVAAMCSVMASEAEGNRCIA